MMGAVIGGPMTDSQNLLQPILEFLPCPTPESYSGPPKLDS